MRFLITNDDGITAPGIAVLAAVAAKLGDVWVVAPNAERSGVAHAITLYKPLRMTQTHPQWFACDGTPTDCVYLALHQLKLQPDFVLSGVNAGPNLGHDVLYSGTVAAALEGAHWHVPSLAISHCSGDVTRMGELEPLLDALLPQLLQVARSQKGAVNVNLPAVALGPWQGVKAARMGHRLYVDEVIARVDPRGRNYYWIGGNDVKMPDIAGSDCNAVRDGFVSVTPLGDDLTRHSELGQVGLILAQTATTEVPWPSPLLPT